MSYAAPVNDMMFVATQLAALDEVAKLPGCDDATPETVEAILHECARFVADVVAPLNQPADNAPSTLADGVVTTSKGFRQAFRQFVEGGWQGLQHPQRFGGQGLPKLVGTPCVEMLNAANLSFALCPLLTDGAIEALLTGGSDELQERYIPRMVSGEWTGTMNLTEAQAGSDLALVRAKAVPQADGSYRISGQKIFITFGEHDMAENIVHLVLARTPGAPEGVKGISLFVVPKFLVDDDGGLGKRNDVWCSSIEHKLGIKASPTAVLLYGAGKGEVGTGEGGAAGAIGYLVGQENRGLEYMFVMMNAARFAVGMQGVALADRAYQRAVAYARDRVQSRDVGGSSAAVAIIRHPDVRRMLMTMRASTEAARALAYVAAAASDAGHRHDDAGVRAQNMAFYEFLVPIVKGWSTEMSLEVASLGVQVHGGMGFIEETGAAQYYRDARILTIYEGTTAIQANDLVGRKTARDGGRVARAAIGQVRQTETMLAGSQEFEEVLGALVEGRVALESVVDYVVERATTDVHAVFAGSVAYLRLAGIVLGGWQMARAALAARRMIDAGEGDRAFLEAKIATARFFAAHLMVQAPALAASVLHGGESVMALAEDRF
ncbi:MAG: acyl-CoA dehydrogenase C-terminal domain-containing protein [Burkholderiaceae bacterium]|nr:acyl-CoA dehydrogenase C-terminal domain-containing protein [Burkholderiaceae bacterium]